jgi:hypothetical protein
MEGGRRTDGLVDHVDLEREVLAVDVVLGGGVHVELDKPEVGALECRRAVHDDLDRRPEVLKHNALLRDVDDGAVCRRRRAVCAALVALDGLAARDNGVRGTRCRGRVQVDGRLSGAGAAGFVLDGQVGPLEWPVLGAVAEGWELDGAFGALVHAEAMEAGGGDRRGQEEGREEHCGG